LTPAQTSFGIVEDNVAGIGTRWHKVWGDAQEQLLDVAAKLTLTVTGSTPTMVQSLTSGEAFTLTTPATDYAGLNGSFLGEIVKLDAGKPVKLYGRWKCGEATQSDFLFGLAATKTDLLAVSDGHAISPSVEGVFFTKLDNATGIYAKTHLAGVETNTALVGTMDTSAHEYEIDWDSTILRFYLDGVKVAAFSTGLPTVDLTLSFNVRAGSAAANTFTIYDPKPRVIQARS
jgi:hypothetical protein